MIFLQVATCPDWARQLESAGDKILLDHTHWEKESASWCLKLLLAYCDNESLSIAMSNLITQKLSRFQQMRELITSLGIGFRRQQPIGYDKRLKQLIVKKEPGRVVDRLLISALQEARSYERFALIAEKIEDTTIAQRYLTFVENDPKNYVTFIDLAKDYQDELTISKRLDELAAYEASLINEGGAKPRLHS